MAPSAQAQARAAAVKRKAADERRVVMARVKYAKDRALLSEMVLRSVGNDMMHVFIGNRVVNLAKDS